MFDEKTQQQLGYYVYALFDEDRVPFYVGKGIGNRVFSHAASALADPTPSDKLEQIRAIRAAGREVRHVIIRHGLTEATAFAVEASLIDLMAYMGQGISNIVGGHHSEVAGLMTADEIRRQYNAERLDVLGDDVILININKKYTRGSGAEGIYEATRRWWVIGAAGRLRSKYVLAEYRGLIVEVFEVLRWEPLPYSATGEERDTKIRWGFEGRVAKDEIRGLYINRSVAHAKRQGAANPIRYRL